VARKGREVKLDLKIGIIHHFPNGELLFENAEDIKKVENFVND